MTVDLFEQLVLSKPYFDRQGLIVAFDDDTAVGFVHAGFGPTDDRRSLLHDLGTTYLVMVRANYQHQGIAAELLNRSEAYLQASGARVLYGGGIGDLNGFYLGLLGGSEMPGVLDSMPRAQRLFQAAGYGEIDRTRILHRDLVGYRPPVDRNQVQLRRKVTVSSVHEPTPSDWWEACTLGPFETIRFELEAREARRCVASATFWDMHPFSVSWGSRVVGLCQVQVDQAFQRQGYATFLLSEAFRQLAQLGISQVEAQVMVHNTAAAALYHKLGFVEVDQAAVYRKQR